MTLNELRILDQVITHLEDEGWLGTKITEKAHEIVDREIKLKELNSIMTQAQGPRLEQTKAEASWRQVAVLFHNALVGAGMAGAFNHQLCEQAVQLFDALEARDGKMHPDDSESLLARMLQCQCGLFSDERYEYPPSGSAQPEKPE